jgi:mannosyl-oligosaccharide glucosidase
MAGYGWEEYDIRKGGRQTVHDTGNSIDMTIDFVKVPGGLHGGSWAARVKGVPREDAPADLFTTVVFYTSLEGLGSVEVEKGDDEDSVGFEGDVKLKGMTPELGDFSIDVTSGPDTNEHPKFTHPSYDEKPLYHSFVSSLEMPQEHLWQAKSKSGLFPPSRIRAISLTKILAIMFASMKPGLDAAIEKYGTEAPPPPAQLFTLPNIPGEGNIHFVQKVFEGAFEFDILFQSGSAPKPLTCMFSKFIIRANIHWKHN